MTLPRLSLLLVASAAALSSCVDPGMYPPGGGGMLPPGGGYGPGNGGYGPGQGNPPNYIPPRPHPGPSDYLPHLATEYRNGYDIGQRDAQLGYPRDYRRAYERFGGGYESYFQEGYGHGYDGRPMQH